MRHTKAHTKNRRSHHGVSGVTLSRDTKTGVVHQRHRLCMTTGKYRGRQIIDPTKLTKARKKAQQNNNDDSS